MEQNLKGVAELKQLVNDRIPTPVAVRATLQSDQV